MGELSPLQLSVQCTQPRCRAENLFIRCWQAFSKCWSRPSHLVCFVWWWHQAHFPRLTLSAKSLIGSICFRVELFYVGGFLFCFVVTLNKEGRWRLVGKIRKSSVAQVKKKMFYYIYYFMQKQLGASTAVSYNSYQYNILKYYIFIYLLLLFLFLFNRISISHLLGTAQTPLSFFSPWLKWSFASFLGCRSSPSSCPALHCFFFPSPFSFPPSSADRGDFGVSPGSNYTNPPKAKCTGPNRTPGEEASSFSRSTRKQTRRRRRKMWRSGDTFSPPFCNGVGLGVNRNRERWRGLACSSLWLCLEFSCSSMCRWKESCGDSNRRRRRRRKRGPVRAPSTSILSWTSECPILFMALCYFLLAAHCHATTLLCFFFLEARGTSLSFSPLYTFLRELAALQLPVWKILSNVFRSVS